MFQTRPRHRVAPEHTRGYWISLIRLASGNKIFVFTGKTRETAGYVTKKLPGLRARSSGKKQPRRAASAETATLRGKAAAREDIKHRTWRANERESEEEEEAYVISASTERGGPKAECRSATLLGEICRGVEKCYSRVCPVSLVVLVAGDTVELARSLLPAIKYCIITVPLSGTRTEALRGSVSVNNFRNFRQRFLFPLVDNVQPLLSPSALF